MFVFSPDLILCGRLGSKHQVTNKLHDTAVLLITIIYMYCCIQWLITLRKYVVVIWFKMFSFMHSSY